MAKFSAALESEITERMEICEATRCEVIKELMQDMDDRDSVAYEFRRELENYGAEVGIFRSFSREQIESTRVSGRGKKYDFKRGDAFYVFETWKPLDCKAA